MKTNDMLKSDSPFGVNRRLAYWALEAHPVLLALHQLITAEPENGFLHTTSGGYRLNRLHDEVERVFGVARPRPGWIVVSIDKEGVGRRPVYCFRSSLARFVQRLKALGLTSTDFSMIEWDDQFDQFFSIRLDPSARIHMPG